MTVGIAVILALGLILSPISFLALQSSGPQAVAAGITAEFAVLGLLSGIYMAVSYHKVPGNKDDGVGGAASSILIFMVMLLIVGASVWIAKLFGAETNLPGNPYWSPLRAGMSSVLAHQVGFWPVRAIRRARAAVR